MDYKEMDARHTISINNFNTIKYDGEMALVKMTATNVKINCTLVEISVLEFILSQHKKSFREVVTLQYPAVMPKSVGEKY